MRQDKSPKLPKGVSEEFVDEVNSQTTEQLKATVVRLQMQYAENEDFKETEQYLAAQAEFDYAKGRWDEVAGPVKDTTVSIRNKTKMVVERLKEKGQS